MKKSPLQQRKMKKTLKCKEGYSMQPKLDSKGNPMKDPSGGVIKSCQMDDKNPDKTYTRPDRESGKKKSPVQQKSTKRDYKKLTKVTNQIGEGSDKQDVRKMKKMGRLEDRITKKMGK